MHIELKIFPSTASEKRKEIGDENTKERVLRMTSGKIVDYTESSELEDNTSSSCEKIVDHDFNTDTPNVKVSVISGKLPTDAQQSSDYEEQDDIPISSKREKLEGKSAEKKTNEELFSSDDKNKSNSIIDDIICNLDLCNFDVKNVKEQLVSKSMEAFWLDNSEELLTDAIHKSAVVSETGEETNKVPVESTSDTTLLTTQSDSDSEAELVIIQKNEKKK